LARDGQRTKGRENRSGLWGFFRTRLDDAGRLLEADETERREKEGAIIDSLATEVHRRGFGAAGVFIAESAKPLSYLVSQGLHFVTPHAGLFLGEQRFSNIACLIEDRANLERLASRLEALEAEEKAKTSGSRAGKGR
jgi:hypothetical protein